MLSRVPAHTFEGVAQNEDPISVKESVANSKAPRRDRAARSSGFWINAASRIAMTDIQSPIGMISASSHRMIGSLQIPPMRRGDLRVARDVGGKSFP